MRTISPPRSDWRSLANPLQGGELAVLEALDAGLPLDWEIFVRPHMNGLEPDIVLLSEERGIRVLEIKDSTTRSLSAHSLESAVGQACLYYERVRDLYCPRVGGKSGLLPFTQVVLPNVPRNALLSTLTPSGSRSES